jgi:hypothetical protein
MERIDGEDELYRRILHYYYDEKTRRISSSAFMRKKKKLDPEVSVFLARLTDPRAVLAGGLPGQRLISLLAQLPIDLGLRVAHDPINGFPGHCVITNFHPDRWKEQCDRLAEGSNLVEILEIDPTQG